MIDRDYVLYLVLAGLAVINIYAALVVGNPLNWAAAAFIALIALRPR
jgi:hypothetical protein